MAVGDLIYPGIDDNDELTPGTGNEKGIILPGIGQLTDTPSGTTPTNPVVTTIEGYSLYVDITSSGSIDDSGIDVATLPIGFNEGFEYTLDSSIYFRLLATDGLSETMSRSLTSITGDNLIYVKTYITI